MAEFITDVIDPVDLLGFARANAVVDGPNLGGILPGVEVNDIAYELEQINMPVGQIARYRAWDTPNHLGTRPGVATVTGEILPLGLSLHLNEKELARFNRLRDGVRRFFGDQVVADIYDDARNTARAVANRYELARADLLHDGIVTLAENGVNLVANFGVPGTHLVTAATAWSNTGASVPVTNLLAWEAVYRADNGGLNPDAWLISSEVAGQLALNTQIKGLASGTSSVVPGIISIETVGAVLRAAGVRAPLVVFDGMVPNTSGVATPTIPVRDVIAVRAGMGSVLFGVTPSANQMVARGLIKRRDALGVVVFATEEIVPASVTTTAEGLGLPVLRDPNALFRAIV